MGVARSKTLHAAQESHAAEKGATKMRAKRPPQGIPPVVGPGSGTWDKASRRVMVLLCPKAAHRSSLGKSVVS